MKTILFIGSLTVLCAAYIHHAPGTATTQAAQREAFRQKKLVAFGCSPDFSQLDFSDSASAIPLLSGWGNYRMGVSANNDSARLYFEQGINMYYGFHIIEALASFDKAVQFDTSFAMGYWGQALSYGPNINDFGYSASPEALVATRKASEHSESSTPLEKALIGAMQVRYSADTLQSRETLNQLYADAMSHVYQQFPNDADAGTLYADALMLQHPWDLYDKHTYEPKPWTPAIVAVLEKVLQKSPLHPGASHYYIHAIEASEHPEKGMEVARRLPGLMPGVAHVVHMPSHIYIRSGYYNEGEKVNKEAVKSYYGYQTVFPVVENNSPLYLIHNLHMQAACANMNGVYSAALNAANDCRATIDSTLLAMPGFWGVYIQYIYMTPVITQVRFGKWKEVLGNESIPEKFVYARLLDHYARGMAYARLQQPAKAKEELTLLQNLMANEQLAAEGPAYANPGIAGARVAEKMLTGVIAEATNQLPEAINAWLEAVNLEDEMVYDEPRDWLNPTRHYLGKAYLTAGKYNEAEKAYREDLKINPNNGWSLTGLSVALSKQGKTKEAITAKAQAAKAFSSAESFIASSAY